MASNSWRRFRECTSGARYSRADRQSSCCFSPSSMSLLTDANVTLQYNDHRHWRRFVHNDTICFVLMLTTSLAFQFTLSYATMPNAADWDEVRQIDHKLPKPLMRRRPQHLKHRGFCGAGTKRLLQCRTLIFSGLCRLRSRWSAVCLS